MRMQTQMQMIVDSVEVSWEFDVEDLSRSYSFLRAPEDREKTRLHQVHSSEIWIMYVPPSQASRASLVQPQNGSQTEELPAIRAT
jgi:hypothetical protein